MGWSGGSELAEDIWILVGDYIPEEKKIKIARKIVALFEELDCDTMYEAETLMEAADLHDGIEF